MRTTLMLVLLAGLSTGCKSLLGRKPGDEEAKPRGEIPQRSAKDLVDYLNRQSSYLDSLSYSDVNVYVTQDGRDLPKLGESSLHAQKPRNFRLLCATGFTNGEVDLGSNDREFWMYVKRIEDAPNFVYCSHQDFANGAARRLPIPFDTDWVMQALGLANYNPGDDYSVDTNTQHRKYILTHRTVTAAGTPVRHVIAFNVDHDSGRRPVVWKHLIADDRNTTLATAEIVSAKTVMVNGQYAQVPTEVVLEWPQQKTKMRLVLHEPKVNEDMRDRAALFSRPQIKGSNPVNLATYFEPTGRGQMPDRRKR